MYRLFVLGTIIVAAALLLACSSPTPIPAPTATPEPPPTPTAAPTATLPPTPTPTAAPTANLVPASGGIVPLALDNVETLLSELSEAEGACLATKLELGRLMVVMNTPNLATADEAAQMLECVEDETVLRLFVTGLIGLSGPLSEETSLCVRSGLEGIAIRAMMLGAVTGSDGAAGVAMTTSMVAFALTLSCLNESEWRAVATGLGLGQDDRESLECLLDEAGGPEELTALLQPGASPSLSFIGAAMKCGMPMDDGG